MGPKVARPQSKPPAQAARGRMAPRATGNPKRVSAGKQATATLSDCIPPLRHVREPGGGFRRRGVKRRGWPPGPSRALQRALRALEAFLQASERCNAAV